MPEPRKFVFARRDVNALGQIFTPAVVVEAMLALRRNQGSVGAGKIGAIRDALPALRVMLATGGPASGGAMDFWA
ncbi:MAG TPA: hypothetical protein VIS73_05730, partial [Rhodocyclaceae bacterium]